MTDPKTESTALALPSPNGGLVLPSSPSFSMALEPRSLDEAIKLAGMAFQIKLCGVKSVEEALIRLMYGRYLDLPAFAAIQHVFVTPDGKPGVEAMTMVAVCLARPSICEYFEQVPTSDPSMVATWRAKRRNRNQEQQFSFSVDEAKQAGLLDKNNWKQYRADMLANRAAARTARRVFPDLIQGFYTREELENTFDIDPSTGEVLGPTPTSGAPLVHGPARDLAAECAAIVEAIKVATTKEELEAARAKIRSFDGGEPYLSTMKTEYQTANDARKVAKPEAAK